MIENGSGAAPIGGDRIYRITAIFLLLALATVMLQALARVFQPFLLAVLLFYIAAPAVEFLRRKKVPLPLAVAVIIIAAFGIFYLFGLMVVAHIDLFNAKMPVYEDRISVLFRAALDRVGVSTDFLSDLWTRYATEAGEKGLQTVGGAVRKIGSGAALMIGNLMMTLFFLIFILFDFENFPERIKKAFGPEKAPDALRITSGISEGIQNYLLLKTGLSAATGFAAYVVMLALGLDFAVLWGILAFTLNFIPTFGSIIATIPPILIALVSFTSPLAALALAILLMMIQMVIGNVIEPKIFGKQLNLSAVVVLLSLVYWGWVWGIFGMFIAVPATSALKVVLDQFEGSRPIAILMSGLEAPRPEKK